MKKSLFNVHAPSVILLNLKCSMCCHGRMPGATGPRAWNTWTANLMQELFFKILNIFLGEELATRDASNKAEETLLKVQKAFPALKESEQNALFFGHVAPISPELHTP